MLHEVWIVCNIRRIVFNSLSTERYRDSVFRQCRNVVMVKLLLSCNVCTTLTKRRQCMGYRTAVNP